MKHLSMLAAIAALCGAPAALAHVHLTLSTPADGSVLAAAPAHIVLKFSESARLTALTISAAHGAGAQQLGPLPKQPGENFEFAPPRLEPGVYTVQYRALDPEDGHVSSGHFSFTLTPAAMRDVGKHPAPATAK